MTEIVADDDDFDSPGSHSPVPSVRSDRSSNSRIDLDMPGLSRSYLQSPDHDGDNSYVYELEDNDDDLLGGRDLDDSDDELGGRRSPNSLIGGRGSTRSTSSQKSDHSSARSKLQDFGDVQSFVPTSGCYDQSSEITVVPAQSASFYDRFQNERRLNTIAEESRSNVYSCDLPHSERALSPWAAGADFSMDGSRLKDLADSAEFQPGSNAMDMMNQAERSFTNRHVLIQDDVRFNNPSQYEADNSWDKWASTAPSVVPSRPSRSDLPPNSNSFTGESEHRRQSKKEKTESDQNFQERTKRTEKPLPFEESVLGDTFASVTQPPRISTPKGDSSNFVAKSGLRQQQKKDHRLSEAFGSLSKLSDTVSSVGSSKHFSRSEQASEASLVHGISTLELSTAPLSSSGIQRCLQDMSHNANSSELARAIQRADESLKRSKKKKQRAQSSQSSDSRSPSSKQGNGNGDRPAMSEMNARETSAKQLKMEKAAKSFGRSRADLSSNKSLGSSPVHESPVKQSLRSSKSVLSGSCGNSRDSSAQLPALDSRKSSMEDLQSGLKTALSSVYSRDTTLTSNSPKAEKRSASASTTRDNRSQLLANKQRVHFGFVDVGDRMVQSVQVENSSSDWMRIRLEIVRPNKGFQLTDGEAFLMLSPKERTSIRIAFQPTQIALFNNTLKLSIVNSAVTFSIVLCGNGGCAKVTMEKEENVVVSQSGRSYLIETSRFGNLPLKLTNRGTAHAFVRVIVAEKATPDSPLEGALVSPTDSIVIRCGETRELSVALPDLSHLGQFNSFPQASNDDDSAGRIRIFLLWGEEKQRQRIKRYEQLRNKALPFEGRSFTSERFCGEENVSALPDGTTVNRMDFEVFLTALRRTPIKVFSNRLSLAGSVASSGGQHQLDQSAMTTFALLDVDTTTAGIGHELGRTIVPDLTTLFTSPPRVRTPQPPVSPKRSRLGHSPPERDSLKSGKKFLPSAVTCKETAIKFVHTRIGAWDSVKIELSNKSTKYSCQMNLRTEGSAFSVKTTQYTLDSKKFVKFPVYFYPTTGGQHRGRLLVTLEDGTVITVELEGIAI